MKSVEILAPAGSYESMVAAINAGADAVYMGGSRFGARAYADNPAEDQWMEAIDYAHLHGRRLYMTVNTLTKEDELGELDEFLRPYYRQGLDAVIVQDMGVFSQIRRDFPDLPIHASTQMTITGCHGARILKELGTSRVVTARELSLEEIRKIRDEVDIEIESFVHGALCYCYSGQCLMSSFIGGRSGNRGRCAQPCRLPYDIIRETGGKGRRSSLAGDERYLLSLKDLCTLDILPDIIEAGVYSLKIEGRMKSPRYTAGVVSIYRKYVDRYLLYGRDGYTVAPEDKAQLLELFDRGGLTDGYYQQHNSRDMVALKEKPSFRAANQKLFDYLDETYVNKKKQEPVYGLLNLREGEAAGLTLWMEQSTEQPPEEPVTVSVTGAMVQTAMKQPLNVERLEIQMKKTGSTPFYFAELEIYLEGSCFMPMQELNELRRTGLKALEEQLLGAFRREAEAEQTAEAGKTQQSSVSPKLPDHGGYQPLLHVSLEQPELLDTVLAEPDVDAVYLDAAAYPAELWEKSVRACHKADKQCLLIMPHIFRMEAEMYFMENLEILKTSGFDGLVIRALEEVGFLKRHQNRMPLIYDYTMYGMNQPAIDYYHTSGALRQTLPVELNGRELRQLGAAGREMIVYGYLPAMVSAQCIVKTMGGCSKKPETIYLKDRMGKRLPVKNHCRFCYNTIYNTSPLSLLGMETLIGQLQPAVLRMQLTVETASEAKALVYAYAQSFCHGISVANPSQDYTRGHVKRGIE